VAERGELTPGQATLIACIPVVNFYWMFAYRMRLCEAIDRTLTRAEPIRRQSRHAD